MKKRKIAGTKQVPKKTNPDCGLKKEKPPVMGDKHSCYHV